MGFTAAQLTNAARSPRKPTGTILPSMQKHVGASAYGRKRAMRRGAAAVQKNAKLRKLAMRNMANAVKPRASVRAPASMAAPAESAVGKVAAASGGMIKRAAEYAAKNPKMVGAGALGAGALAVGGLAHHILRKRRERVYGY